MKTLKGWLSNKELRKRMLATLVILIIYRLGCALPVPYVSSGAMKNMFGQGSVLAMLNTISGGALQNCAVFALGVSPYINASIVVELLTSAFPKLKELKKEQKGQDTFELWTRILAIALSILMGIGYYTLINQNSGLEYTTGRSRIFTAVIIVAVLVAGSLVCEWLGQLIDEIGVGDGMSTIIFAGVISRWSTFIQYYAMGSIYVQLKQSIVQYSIYIAISILFIIFSIFLIDRVQRSERRIPIVYDRSGGLNNKSYLPLQVLMSGVLPIIFASTIMSVPGMIALFAKHSSSLYKFCSSFTTTRLRYIIPFAILVILMNHYYVSLQFDPNEMAKNLQKQRGNVPGIRPGRETIEYLSKEMKKLIPAGSIVLVIISVVPMIYSKFTGIDVAMSGSGVIIVVGVMIELMNNLDTYLISANTFNGVGPSTYQKKSRLGKIKKDRKDKRDKKKEEKKEGNK